MSLLSAPIPSSVRGIDYKMNGENDSMQLTMMRDEGSGHMYMNEECVAVGQGLKRSDVMSDIDSSLLDNSSCYSVENSLAYMT